MRADWGREQTAGQVRGPGVAREGFLEEVGLTQPLQVESGGDGDREVDGAGTEQLEQIGLSRESAELCLHRAGGSPPRAAGRGTGCRGGARPPLLGTLD